MSERRNGERQVEAEEDGRGCSTMGPDTFYADLDPGIRFAVKVLHAHGIDTCQSCEGGPGHSYPAPTVDMRGSAHEQPAFAALHHLETYGLEVTSVAQVWNVAQGRIHEVVWRVELRKACPERAEEWPMFAWRSSYLDRASWPAGSATAGN